MVTRILAVDFGMKRIGLALSDERKLIASPLNTLLASGKLEATIEELLKLMENHQKMHRYELEAIVVGYPLKMSGKAGLITDEVSCFIEMLKKRCSFPIIAWDERLTSLLADRAMREGQLNRRKRSQKIDQISAVLILQNYLDSRNLDY